MKFDSSNAIIVPKKWGHEEIYFVGNQIFKKLYVSAGCRLSLQFHQIKNEIMVIRTGKCKIGLSLSPVDLTNPILPELEWETYIAGQSIGIPAFYLHRVEAIEDVCIYEYSTNYLDDVVRVEDDYGRLQK